MFDFARSKNFTVCQPDHFFLFVVVVEHLPSSGISLGQWFSQSILIVKEWHIQNKSQRTLIVVFDLKKMSLLSLTLSDPWNEALSLIWDLQTNQFYNLSPMFPSLNFLHARTSSVWVDHQNVLMINSFPNFLFQNWWLIVAVVTFVWLFTTVPFTVYNQLWMVLPVRPRLPSVWVDYQNAWITSHKAVFKADNRRY